MIVYQLTRGGPKPAENPTPPQAASAQLVGAVPSAASAAPPPPREASGDKYGIQERTVIAALREALAVQKKVKVATASFTVDYRCIESPQSCFPDKRGLPEIGPDLNFSRLSYKCVIFGADTIAPDSSESPTFVIIAKPWGNGRVFCGDHRDAVCESEAYPSEEGNCVCLGPIHDS